MNMNQLDGREILMNAFKCTIGERISFIEMHEHSTIIVFDSRLKIEYSLTGEYTYREHSEKISHKDRVRVFSMLSKAYDQVVTSLEIDDNYRLHLSFENGFTLVIGNQTPSEFPYEQYDIHYEQFTFLFLSDGWDYWKNNMITRETIDRLSKS